MLKRIFQTYTKAVLKHYDEYISDQKRDEAARAQEAARIIVIGGHEQTCGGSHESFYMTAKAQPTTPLRVADQRIKEWPFGTRIVEGYKKVLG